MPSAKPAAPNDFRHFSRVTIRFSDQDSLGHVNNAVYVTWLEAGRVEFIEQFLPPGGPVDMVLVHMELDFLRETRFPGEVLIGGRLTRIGNTSIDSEWAVFRDDTCLARASCVNVFFDVARRRATRPPAAARAWLERELTL